MRIPLGPDGDRFLEFEDVVFFEQANDGIRVYYRLTKKVTPFYYLIGSTAEQFVSKYNRWLSEDIERLL